MLLASGVLRFMVVKSGLLSWKISLEFAELVS